MTATKAEAAAAHLQRAHAARETFANLAGELALSSIDEAYDAQEALHRLLTPTLGAIAGLKIATTTKVMQELMGIDHPCGGAIFASRVYSSPAEIAVDAYVNVRAECEVAVRLGRDLPGPDVTRDAAIAAVSDIAPAFELIEDRNAVYRETQAATLIADNAWSGGVVLGPWRPFHNRDDVENARGELFIDGVSQGQGAPDDPFGALAWLASLAARRKRPLKAGMLVITGSLIPTFTPPVGADCLFKLGAWGEARMRAK